MIEIGYPLASGLVLEARVIRYTPQNVEHGLPTHLVLF